jgi:hypothetical protein
MTIRLPLVILIAGYSNIEALLIHGMSQLFSEVTKVTILAL